MFQSFQQKNYFVVFICKRNITRTLAVFIPINNTKEFCEVIRQNVIFGVIKLAVCLLV